MGILNDNLAELDQAIRTAGAPALYDGLICDGDDNVLMVYNDGTTRPPTAAVQRVIDAFTPSDQKSRQDIIDSMDVSTDDKIALKKLLGV